MRTVFGAALLLCVMHAADSSARRATAGGPASTLRGNILFNAHEAVTQHPLVQSFTTTRGTFVRRVSLTGTRVKERGRTESAHEVGVRVEFNNGCLATGTCTVVTPSHLARTPAERRRTPVAIKDLRLPGLPDYRNVQHLLKPRVDPAEAALADRLSAAIKGLRGSRWGDAGGGLWRQIRGIRDPGLRGSLQSAYHGMQDESLRMQGVMGPPPEPPPGFLY